MHMSKRYKENGIFFFMVFNVFHTNDMFILIEPSHRERKNICNSRRKIDYSFLPSFSFSLSQYHPHLQIHSALLFELSLQISGLVWSTLDNDHNNTTDDNNNNNNNNNDNNIFIIIHLNNIRTNIYTHTHTIALIRQYYRILFYILVTTLCTQHPLNGDSHSLLFSPPILVL